MHMHIYIYLSISLYVHVHMHVRIYIHIYRQYINACTHHWHTNSYTQHQLSAIDEQTIIKENHTQTQPHTHKHKHQCDKASQSTKNTLLRTGYRAALMKFIPLLLICRPLLIVYRALLVNTLNAQSIQLMIQSQLNALGIEVVDHQYRALINIGLLWWHVQGGVES